MPFQVAKQLIRYRNVLVALLNAGLTWIVLIIAPLGLFAVITCTALVFVSSLAIGWLGDLALYRLLNGANYHAMTEASDRPNLNTVERPSASRTMPETSDRRQLPR